ncbi:MAG TPA: S1C family serine protease, partial [Tepidisphaeraceae bacterium]
MRIRARLIAAAVLFLVGVELPLRAAHASDADIIRSGKRATALVEIGDAGTGTAFCIDPKGLFVINHHVVAALPPGQRLRIVINPADDGQRIFETDIVAVSESADLALIWARDATNLTALSLGDDKDLIETQPITAFGYPFGKMLAVDSKHYPSISINTGKVTSLRRDEGKLSHIQVDATINPGNSGGPVLDASGKVVGVISSGVQTFFGPAGINFAVPVSRLRELVNVPHLLLATPAVSYADRFQPVNFTCRVIDLGAEHAGLKLTLTLNSPGMAPRTIDLARNPDGTFSSKAAPATKSAGASRMLAASVLGEKGLVTGWVQDHPIQVGASTVELSKVKTFDRYPNPHVKTSDGRAIQGEVSGLGQIQFASSDGGKIDLASSFRVQVNSASQGEGGVSYRVLARQAEKIIAELGGVISFKDAPENAQGEIETEQPVPAYGGSTEEPLQTIRLPSGIDSAKLGGSGQLLAVHIKPARVFAIIDLHAAKVIRYIPVDADIVVAAAGANDLVIYVHGLHELRRYDLRSGRLLLSSRLEIDRHLDRLEMGASSTGPVLARTGNNLKRFYDVPTLRHMTMQWRQTISNFEQYRASADGATFSGWFGGGAYRLHTWANKVTGRFVGIDYGDLYPNFDGSGLYTLNAVLGPDFSQIVQKTDEHRFLPTWSPGLYVQLGFGGLTSQVQAELHNALDQKAICALPPMPELTVAPKSKPADLWIDRRMMFFPADNLIVSIPFTDDRVVIRHFDFDRAIAKASGGAAMYVKSAPPMRFVDGRPYSYAVQVGGGKQPYKYHLDAGPAG